MPEPACPLCRTRISIALLAPECHYGPYMVDMPGYLKQAWPSTRQIDRRPLTAPLVLTTADNATCRGWCTDVSTGGLGATVAVALKLGNEVFLEFVFPDGTGPIRVRAVVRYTSGFHHGFEFLDLTPTQYAQIVAYQQIPAKKSPITRRR